MSGWVSWAGTCRGQWTAGASSGEPPPSEPLEKGERDRVRVQKAASSTHRFLEGFRETQALPLTDALPALLRLSPRGHLPSWASHRTASSHGLCGDTKSPGLLQRIPGSPSLLGHPSRQLQEPGTGLDCLGKCHLHQYGPCGSVR